jgi:hypothetical protein
MDVPKEFIISARGGGMLLLVMVSHTALQVLLRMVFKQAQVNHGNKPNQINLKLIKQSQ